MNDSGRVVTAFKDFIEGFKLAPLWWRVGLEQTVTRYRRTILGPFWLASSTLATGFSLALVFGSIFGSNLRESFPFIMTGVVAWSVAGGMLIEGSNTYASGAGVMQVQKLPLTFHSFLQIDRMFVNFLHQLVALWVVLALSGLFVVPHWHLLLSIPVIFVTAFFLSIPVGMLSIRFRDINYLIVFIAQALFMLTPVFWRRSQMPPDIAWVVDLNPFAHLLEILRQPLLGHPASLADWTASLFSMLGCGILAFVSVAIFRRRVVFWL